MSSRHRTRSLTLRWLAAIAYDLSLAYLRGEGVSKDLRKAVRFNRYAARTGHPDAELAMGWFYYNGIGVRQDLRSARTWYERSAQHAEPRAWFSLGQLALDRQEFKSAAGWFQRAARRQHPRATYQLGRLYLDGRGVRQDVEHAVNLLESAAKLGVMPARRLLLSKRCESARATVRSDKPLQLTNRGCRRPGRKRGPRGLRLKGRRQAASQRATLNGRPRGR